MKVTLSKNYKKEMTIHQAEVAKEVIKWAKDDTDKPEDYLKQAVLHILDRETDENGLYDGLDRVLEATAVIGTSPKWNVLFDGSEDLDIMFEGYAKTWSGVVYVCAMLSDIWQFDGETDYRSKMYYKFYVEERRRLA